MGNLKSLAVLIALSSAAYCGDTKEVFGQGGLYTETGQGGVTAALVGGGAGFLARPGLAVFGEFNYIPVSVQVPSGYFDVSGYGIQTGGGVRVYLNPKGKTVRAFVNGVVGFMRATATGTTSSWLSSPISVSASVNGGYVGAGFGAEIGPTRFGVRPEFRYLREFVSGGTDGNAPVVMCGFYYRF